MRSIPQAWVVGGTNTHLWENVVEVERVHEVGQLVGCVPLILCRHPEAKHRDHEELLVAVGHTLHTLVLTRAAGQVALERENGPGWG